MNANRKDTQIVITLEEYLDQGTEMWFRTGKKRYGVEAMMVSRKVSFRNELEAVDYTVTDDGVTVILKGSLSEMWTSGLPRVISTYTKPDGSPLSERDFAERDRWIKIVTNPEPDSCYAMHVPLNKSVTVKTASGSRLHTNLPNTPHGDGDYLVCRAKMDGERDLSDVWVLNGLLFPKRYSAE